MSQVPKLLTVAQVAQATGMRKWLLYELIARGKGPPTMRFGRSIRISEPALIEWIEKKQQQS